MTIAQLARQCGVGVETVRYYQRRGLLRTPERPMMTGQGGIRRYDGQDVQQLHFIKSAQAAGFSLEEIRELLALDATQDRARAREMARNRVAALDEKIAALRLARDALHRLANHCASTGTGPCPILTAFED
jgi:MerR family mercuric resistance operon transcriptional regulator